MVYSWCVERLSTEEGSREQFDAMLEEGDASDMRSKRGDEDNYSSLQAFAAQAG